MTRLHIAGRVAAIAAAALLGTACSSTGAAPVAPVATTPPPTLDPAAPAFPTPQAVKFRLAVPAQCTNPRTASITEDSFDPMVDVPHLAQRATAVALVVAQYQRSLWIPNSPTGGANPIGATPRSYTDFKVLQIYKGTLPAWFQGEQVGAPVGSLPECDGGGFEMLNDSTPRVGTRYVIFLTNDLGNGSWAPTGQYARLEVRGQQVYSAQYQKPAGLSWTDVNGAPLEEVVGQIGG